MSRITMVVDVESAPLEQMVKQLNKLVNVLDIRSLDRDAAVERELMLATISVPLDRRDELSLGNTGFDHITLEQNDQQVIVSFSGRPERVDELEALLKPYGIIEIQRTGKVALSTIER